MPGQGGQGEGGLDSQHVQGLGIPGSGIERAADNGQLRKGGNFAADFAAGAECHDGLVGVQGDLDLLNAYPHASVLAEAAGEGKPRLERKGAEKFSMVWKTIFHGVENGKA